MQLRNEFKLITIHLHVEKKKKGVTSRFNVRWPLSTRIIIARENDQRKHQISSLEQMYYKDILNKVWVLSILL